MKKLLTLCLILIGTLSINAKGTSQFVVTTTPKMSCQNCVKKIEGNIRFEKGVKNVEAALDSQTVTVTYDPEKTNEENLTKAFGKLNYKVSKVDANSTKASKGTSCGHCNSKEGKSCDGNHADCKNSGDKNTCDGNHADCKNAKASKKTTSKKVVKK